ncbi:MAG: hypothetical protein JWP80_440 [Pseudomonas sp.]|nr:hypothetical protein [Pseudomonas sp.]
MTMSIITANESLYPSPWVDPVNLDERLPLDCTQLAARQARMSKDELRDLQARIAGPRGMLVDFSTQVAQQGRQAPEVQRLLDNCDPRHLALTEAALRFVLARHHRRSFARNPFVGLPRATLSCVVYDESAPYNLAERYAASEALHALDSRYFVQLIATTYNTVERRLVFQGLLEHFDALLPVEQSIYLEGYRQAQQDYLDREELLYGTLDLGKPLSMILAEQTPANLLASLELSR